MAYFTIVLANYNSYTYLKIFYFNEINNVKLLFNEVSNTGKGTVWHFVKWFRASVQFHLVEFILSSVSVSRMLCLYSGLSLFSIFSTE